MVMSRARSSDGLRIINFHPRYIFQPPTVVSDFLNEVSEGTLSDMTCCRLRRYERVFFVFRICWDTDFKVANCTHQLH